MQKVLIITYYWPPAGGPGVQRWLKFVKYLPEFGFEPIVFIPENPHYPLKDESLLKEVPSGVQVIKHPIFEPYGLASLLSKKKTKRISSGVIQKYKKQTVLERILLWVRGNFFIPDARKYWVRSSCRTLKGIIASEGIKHVITTGPPHSVHLIGLKLKESLDIHWLADFRDPWTSIGYHKKLKLTKASQRKHKKLESLVLNRTDHLVVTSEKTKKEFQSLTNKSITVITNGYDSEQQEQELDGQFTLSHIGSLLTDRNPVGLWRCLSELVNTNEEFRRQLKIQLIGVVGDGVLDSIEVHQLTDYVEVVGYVSHTKVLEYQSKSQALMLLEINAEETKGIIPGKLFEYFNAKRPILAIGPQQWEAGKMVSNHHAGVYFEHSDIEKLKSLILDWFKEYQQGHLKCESKGIEKFHRRELTKKLAKTLQWESS